MSTKEYKERVELLQGTLNLLILRKLPGAIAGILRPAERESES